MKSKKEFLDYYNNLSQNDTELQEKAKKVKSNKLILFLIPACFLIVIIVNVLCSVFSIPNFAFLLPFIIVPLFIVLSIILIVATYKKIKLTKDFENKYKEKLVNFLLEDKEFIYQKTSHMPENIFNESKLFRPYDHYDGEDLVSLKIPNGDQPFAVIFSDIHATETETDKDGNSHQVTVFSGIFGCVTFLNQFKSYINVNVLSLFKKNKVELESIQFNKSFKIYSDDQIFARMILTPDRMERMLTITRPSSVQARLTDNKLYFAFHYTHLFDVKFNKDAVQKISVDDFYNDVKAVSDFTEELKQIAVMADKN